MVPELIAVLGSQPAGDRSHKPGARLPLVSDRPAVTTPAAEHHCPLDSSTKLYCLVTKAYVCKQLAPRTVSWICSRLFSVLGVWLWLGLRLRLLLIGSGSGSGLGLVLVLMLIWLQLGWRRKIAPVTYINVRPGREITPIRDELPSTWLTIVYYYAISLVSALIFFRLMEWLPVGGLMSRLQGHKGLEEWNGTPSVLCLEPHHWNKTSSAAATTLYSNRTVVTDA